MTNKDQKVSNCNTTDEQILYYENFDLHSVVTLVNADKLEYLLKHSNYDAGETKFLIDGFRHGFRLGYQGPHKIAIRSRNLKLRGVGSPTILWYKVTKEVKEGRYAGPYTRILYKHFIQSPIGLVPKDNGKNVHLIFHLSYP